MSFRSKFLAPLLIPFILYGCAPAEKTADTATTTTTSAPVPSPAETSPSGEIEVTGLSTPESALYDAAADAYVVSNINGNPSEKDGNGFIARVSPDGTILDAHWIDGAKDGVTLNAPKGLAIDGSTLYVADIDTIRLFDAASGNPRGEWPVKGASFLNDVAIGPDGSVYVTDSGFSLAGGSMTQTGTDAVYRFDSSGKVQPLAEGTDLKNPNGVVVTTDGVVVVPFGGNGVYRLEDNGQKEEVVQLPKGQLDGVVRLDDGTLFVSSWEGAAVYKVDPAGKVSAAVENAAAPADIGFDSKRNRILIPMFNDNKLRIVPLK